MKETKQPIAIVGMACRFPEGCNTPAEFWKLLLDGTDVITEVRPDRWSRDYYYHPDPKTSGKTYTAAAGQLDNIYQFDPEFFGISPREAAQMDPQQRLLLQMAWEAIEDAAELPRNLAGSNCSVFTGVSGLDYANNRMDDPNVADAYFMTGNTLSIAANRLSYFFDLHGPSMTIDTACSSSLVALHQACSSIWSGESSASLVGAVHLVLSPFPFIGFSKASMLSRLGRCSVFDASADGYVRSEGGVVLYLKPLDQALRDNNPIHALIRGTAVNSDGNTSAMTVPNGLAQASLLRNLYASTGIDINDIAYIEAHGTGTPVGDPIEATALGQAIGSKRSPDRPLFIGSVKTNVGHLEPASGFAGLLKVVLSLKHSTLPATIHQHNPNPQIEFDNLNLRVVKSNTLLDRSEHPLIMGVNSFGFGGTNAHTILEQYREPETVDRRSPIVALPPLFISAMSENSLVRRAAQFRAMLDEPLSEREGYRILHTAALRRTRLKHGLLVAGHTLSEIRQGLADYIEGRKSAHVVHVDSLPEDSTAWIFSGNGCQWQGMGVTLLVSDVFRCKIEEIDRYFIPLSGWSLLEEIQVPAMESRLAMTEVAQPLLFAVQVGIAGLLTDLGLKPRAVAGHSVGEIAAAHIAGSLSLEDAVRVIYFRSIAQGKTRGHGRMAVVRMSAEALAPWLDAFEGHLEIAAYNTPDSLTVSGSTDAIRSLIEQLHGQAIACRELDLDYAFHSSLMDGAEHYIRENLHGIVPTPGSTTLVSTVTGEVLEGNRLDAGYWWRNIRQPVRFSAAISAIGETGTSTFIEIGSHPVLQSYIRDTLQDRGISSTVLKTVRKNDPDEWLAVQTGLPPAVSNPAHGLQKLFPETPVPAPLPCYPWDNSTYMFSGSNEAINRKLEHPLLGYRLNSVEGIWINQIDLSTHPYLADHIVDGVVIFPAAAYVEMALAASRNLSGWDGGVISSIEIRKPMILEPGKTRAVQFTLSLRDMQFSIRSRDRLSDVAWTEHATGRIGQVSSAAPQRLLDVQKMQMLTPVPANRIYAAAAEFGLNYGVAFQGAIGLYADNESLLTRLHSTVTTAPSGHAYLWYPVLLDSAFHSLFVHLASNSDSTEERSPYVPVEMNDIRYYGRGSENMAYSECILIRAGYGLIQAAFVFYDRDGCEVAAIRNCLFRKLPRPDRKKSQPVFYRYSLIPKNPVNPYAVTPLPAVQRILDTLARLDTREILVAEEKTRTEQLIPLLDALTSAIAEKTLQEFGAHLGYFTLESLLGASRIPENYAPLILNLLEMLEQDGKAVRQDNQWKLHDAEEPDDPTAIWRSILADYPGSIDILREVAVNGLRLKQVLSGAEIPRTARSFLPAPSELQQGLLKHVFAQIMDAWPRQDRRLRIAEIRSRPVTTPGNFIPDLPVGFCDYEILATSDEAAIQAEELYRDCANIAVSRIHLSADELQPRYRQGEFDLALVFGELAHNGSITELLTGLQWLLASGGMLVTLEKRPDRISDLITGISEPEKWQRSGSNSRAIPGSMHAEDWINVLENSGFEEIHNLADTLCEQASRYLLVARRPQRQMIEQGKAPDDTNVLLIASADGVSHELARTLRDKLLQTGVRTQLAVDGTGKISGRNTTSLQLNHPELPRQLAGMIDPHNTTPLSILYLGAFNDKPGEADSADTAARVTAGNLQLLNLVRSLSGLELKNKPVLRIVTTGAAAGYSGTEEISESNPFQAGMWALGRVIRNEYPDIDCRLIDLQQLGSLRQAARSLLQEIISGDGEEEVVISDSVRRVLRLDKVDTQWARAGTGDTNDAIISTLNGPAVFENILWQQTDRRLPDVDQIEIEVRATGLNFRDIMFTSGLLPPEMLEGGHSGATLGLECSGVVTRVGPFVSGYNIGDEVIAMASACFASHVIASRHSVMKKPAGWSFEAAATVPTAFFTVYYSLHYMARLRKGERILIHGATGAVGLAAIQYARYCGAEIFATAGSDEKRMFLSQLGVEHVLNSRTLDFADDILTMTNGEGVDVVLNSLAGEAMIKNFSVLRPFGRFIELGKRDFFENTKLDLKPFRNNIAYFGVDADQLLSHEPELSGRLMAEVFELFGAGIFRPLPYTRFISADVHEAFRYMQQSRHIGKIVVCNSPDRMKIHARPRHHATLELDPDASYLITGGTGGFGLATARWMVDKGARHLVLAGRGGLRSVDETRTIEQLIARNIDVRVVQCDVTDALRLQSLLNEIQLSGHPLKGIIHSAMVIEDAAIKNMDDQRMYAVTAPKVQGAWNLHRLTLNLELDLFVMYSSATTCLGNPGQANYVAANAFLEALARMRRYAGLPATVVSWDAITDTGYLVRNEHIAGRLNRKLGLGGIQSAQALDALENLLQEEQTETIVMNANWSSLRQILPVLNSNLFRNIMQQVGMDAELGGEDLIDLLAGLTQKEKQPVIVSFLIREIARILQTSEEKIAHNSTIQDMGVDSLMAMELANTIESRLGINLPVITLADNITIDNLALRIIDLLGSDAGTMESNITDIVGSLARIHAEEMTTEQLATLTESVNSDSLKSVRLIQ